MAGAVVSPAVEVVADDGAIIGESPTWVPREGALYWVDIQAPALSGIHHDSGARQAWPLPSDCGAFALVQGQAAALVALRTGLFRLDLATGSLDRLLAPPFDPTLFRFNEGIVDETGRFWFGVMFDPLKGGTCPDRRGHLRSYSSAEGMRVHEDMAEIHNGTAFAPGGRSLFVSHSKAGTIHRRRFDPGNGTLGDPELFATIPPAHGIPDGAAMDAEGHYWSALYGGGRLRRFTPEGAVERDIVLPVSKPTMCCFAGDALDVLYVTSASEKMSAEQRRAEPLAGALLRLRPGVRGLSKPVYAR